MAIKDTLNRRYLLALLAGASLPLAFEPLAFIPLAFLAPALLFYLWLEATPRQAMISGYLFGVGLFGIGVSWVYVAIHEFGHAPVPLAVLLTTLFVAFLALYYGLLGYLAAYLHQRLAGYRYQRVLTLLLLFPALWVLLEWVRSWFLTGFPWLNIGYSQIDSGLSGFAPLLGVYGLSWLTLVGAALLLLLLLNPVRRRQLGLLAIFVGLHLTGFGLKQLAWTDPQGEPLQAALIQGNLPQETRWNPEALQTRLTRYAELTEQHWDSDIIVWPENAVSTFYHYVEDTYLAELGQRARKNGTDVVLGLPVMDRDNNTYYSSMISVGRHPGMYHKVHLVPFGEYVPLESILRGTIAFFDLPMSSFSPGDREQPLLQAGGQPVATTVCYEDAFGEEVIRQLPEATLMINGSNNAWYGNSFAPHQHLQIARLRALETGRPLLRATTNGVSALVDHKGTLMARSKQFETDVVRGEIQPRRGSTPYVRFGNLPVLMLLLVAGGLILFLILRSRQKN
ncbi:apolipoprotein N-acyltransferase [Thiohalophilus thiocyanatoxydans]|uniref:apolipoprotein N-acyltransferase n=1 Tax=Thiohalophilus thiocyanatoxydans TaxID=381308 RepID=UPI001FBAAAF2|nr:apolipoprotein N-acyltransferase [Thiohalophilus thiocyanatoxydans]